MTQQAEIDRIYKSISKMESKIDSLGTSLHEKIDSLNDKVDTGILDIHKEYTQRLTKLETSARNQWHIRILYGLLGAAITFILNHIIPKML